MNTIYRTLANYGYKAHIVFRRLSLFLILLTCLTCRQEPNSFTVPEVFEQVKVTPVTSNEIKVDITNKGRNDSFVLNGSDIMIIRPFDAKIDIIDLNSGELKDTLPLKKPSKEFGGLFLKQGSAKNILVEGERFYLIEIALSKIIEYDIEWNELNTFYLPEGTTFSIDKSSIFEKEGNSLIISIDDIKGRLASNKILLDDDDPLLVAFNQESSKFSTILNAKYIRKIMQTDTIPFVSMASSRHGYFLTSEFDPTLHHFDKSGQLVDSYDFFKKYMEFDEYQWSDFLYQFGISDLFVEEDHITYFIKRKTTLKAQGSFEVVNFNIKTGKFWKFSIERLPEEDVKLLDFKEQQLYYLHTLKDNSSYIKMVSFTEAN